ncbi:MAG: nuclease, partial [Flammeovirgaceae bacterium]|nr:nuclease [Flammeovirgaceae bacterium]
MSVFGLGVANNGNGSNGQEYVFPAIAVEAGDDILVVRSLEAQSSYFGACFSDFEYVFDEGTNGISQNGDDAIELFENGIVVEVFGDPDVDGSGEEWEYLDSWAYAVDGVWTYGGVNCSDGSTTTFDSNCPYPLCEIPDDIPGCTDESAFNFNPNATLDDGSCEAVLVDCMLSGADNFNEDANTACEDCCIFGGCTDPEALNFNEDANS